MSVRVAFKETLGAEFKCHTARKLQRIKFILPEAVFKKIVLTNGITFKFQQIPTRGTNDLN